jgi:hypothetical protein
VTAFSAEAWCPRCRVTHVPGTTRCIHCGGPVLPERPAEGGARSAPTARAGGFSPWPEAPPDDPDAEARARTGRPLRISMAAIWVLIAILGAILRHCNERG